jgi:hypothetical protein
VAKDAVDERAGESPANSPAATIQESEMDNERHSPTRPTVRQALWAVNANGKGDHLRIAPAS